ncbi:signal peptidase I [Desulforhopalus singaporensis]|nr:signal peptidase I [Desulforhopalus singaporensis]
MSARRFLLPKLDRWFALRVTAVALTSYLVFGYVLIPLHIRGRSMEPTYHDNSFNFSWRQRYLLVKPKRFAVVTVRFSGTRVMLLKRIIAFAGETVEYRKGQLFINGRKVDEPYVKYQSNWNLEPRTVSPDHVYVIGDNRSGPMDRHQFGEVHVQRIAGGVLW